MRTPLQISLVVLLAVVAFGGAYAVAHRKGHAEIQPAFARAVPVALSVTTPAIPALADDVAPLPAEPAVIPVVHHAPRAVAPAVTPPRVVSPVVVTPAPRPHTPTPSKVIIAPPASP